VRSLMILLGVMAVGCLPSFTPPDAPKHDDDRGGHLHAALSETPFLCPDPANPPLGGRRENNAGMRCATSAARPQDVELSCDAMGCHGGYEYRDDPATALRHLRGSNGPSCYTCHGEVWQDNR